jgi:hypothetical protein
MIDPGHLSPLAMQLLNTPDDAYRNLVVHGSITPIASQVLPGLSGAELLKIAPQSTEYAQAVLAGLWLRHDGLEECHQVVQKVPLQPEVAATFNFWHAIMHRREGDFSNSKYWYHQAGDHPILPALGQHVGDLINHLPADKSLLRILRGGWNPDAWVDLVEEVDSAENDPRRHLLINIQQIEWRMLFEHCVRQAAGS